MYNFFCAFVQFRIHDVAYKTDPAVVAGFGVVAVGSSGLGPVPVLQIHHCFARDLDSGYCILPRFGVAVF